MLRWTLILAGWLTATFASDGTPDFSRYAFIIERAPFGTPAPAVTTTAPPAESPLATFRLSALVLDSLGRPQVGLVDERNGRSYFLRVGQSEDGIEVLAVRMEEESATVRVQGQEGTLRLAGAASPPSVAPGRGRAPAAAGAPAAMGLMRGEGRPPMVRGRASMMAIRPPSAPAAESSPTATEAAPNPRPPTPEEIEKRLQEFQMEALRRGLPPLPIPLTPEMDEQLVREGVLPPQ